MEINNMRAARAGAGGAFVFALLILPGYDARGEENAAAESPRQPGNTDQTPKGEEPQQSNGANQDPRTQQSTSANQDPRTEQSTSAHPGPQAEQPQQSA